MPCRSSMSPFSGSSSEEDAEAASSMACRSAGLGVSILAKISKSFFFNSIWELNDLILLAGLDLV